MDKIRYDEMAIYDFKEFLTIDDVAEYLRDKKIYDFDLSQECDYKKLQSILNEWVRFKKITPVFYNTSTVDVISYQYNDDNQPEIKYIDGCIGLDGYYGIDPNTYAFILKNGMVKAKHHRESTDDNILSYQTYITSTNIGNGNEHRQIDYLPYFIVDTYKPKIIDGCFVYYQLFADDIAIIKDDDLFYPKEQLNQIFLHCKKDKLQEQINTIDSQLNETDERTENSYLTTIGILLELLKTPKGIDARGNPNKPLFDSNAQIIHQITDLSIYGQGKSTLENRFARASEVLDQVKKK